MRWLVRGSEKVNHTIHCAFGLHEDYVVRIGQQVFYVCDWCGRRVPYEDRNGPKGFVKQLQDASRRGP